MYICIEMLEDWQKVCPWCTYTLCDRRSRSCIKCKSKNVINIKRLKSSLPEPILNCIWIPLTKNKFALIDEGDFEKVNKYNWSMSGEYARIKNTKNNICMHNLILGKLEKGFCIDHIDGDKLNNRKRNLRIATHSQNMKNKKLAKNNKTGYKGVHFCNTRQYFVARIAINKKRIVIGTFIDVIEAAKAYDKAAIKYHGEFARTNFPKSNYTID